MDTKEIVQKALRGEDYSNDVKDFDETQKSNLSLAIRAAVDAEVKTKREELTAITKEKERRQAQLDNPPKDTKKDTEVLTQFREEQVLKAKQKFFSDPKFSLNEQEKTELEETFKRLDSGKVDADLIFNDLKKAFAFIKSDSLLTAGDKLKEFEKNAVMFGVQSAKSTTGSGTGDDNKYSEAARDLHNKWNKAGYSNKTLDDAQRIIDRANSTGSDGFSRNISGKK